MVPMRRGTFGNEVILALLQDGWTHILDDVQRVLTKNEAAVYVDYDNSVRHLGRRYTTWEELRAHVPGCQNI